MSDHDTREPIPVLDLFTGIGGFTLAFESVMADAERGSSERRGRCSSMARAQTASCNEGDEPDSSGNAHIDRSPAFRTIGFAEIEPYPVAVLEQRWPDVPQLGSVESVTRDSIIERCGVLPTVITGGFPCQPHSLAGRRGASDDERDEWDECVRMLRDLRPKFAIFENVPGLFTSKDYDPDGQLVAGLFLNRIMSDLAALRYACQWQVISAEDVGAPHRRDRIWIVCVDELAYSRDDGRGRGRGQERRELESTQGGQPDRCSSVRRELGEATELADSSSRRRRERGQPSERDRLADGSAAIVADADRAGWREQRGTKPIQSRHDTAQYGGHPRSWPAAAGAWPARRGEPQHWWEPPRVVGDAGSGRREQRDSSERGLPITDEAGGQAQSIVGRNADGLSYWTHSTINRTSRLKALGNSIVPAVATIFARAIYRVIARAEGN